MIILATPPKTVTRVTKVDMKKNIARIAKRCPENITSVVKCVKCLFPKVPWELYFISFKWGVPWFLLKRLHHFCNQWHYCHCCHYCKLLSSLLLLSILLLSLLLLSLLLKSLLLQSLFLLSLLLSSLLLPSLLLLSLLLPSLLLLS